MKYLLILILGIGVVACGSQKETTQEIEANEPTLENEQQEAVELILDESDEEDVAVVRDNYRVVGIVHVSETGCPVFIETRLKDKTVKMYPMNLDDRYKKEGMKLKFVYALSRGVQPIECDIDMVVSVSDVSLMR